MFLHQTSGRYQRDRRNFDPRRWDVDPGRWNFDSGRWNFDPKRWNFDPGMTTYKIFDPGRWGSRFLFTSQRRLNLSSHIYICILISFLM